MSRQRRQQRGNRSAHSTSSSSTTSAEAARAEAAPVEAPPWWKRAGDWVADKYDDVATAVGEGIESAGETLSDGWDVITNTDVDVDWSDRKVMVATDMDEVMDLMPEDVRGALQLDRDAAGANEVSMELDYRNDTMTIVSKDVRLMGVNTPEMSAKGTSLRDVRITIKGEGGLPMVGNATKTSVDIQFSKAVADELTAQTENGPVSATRVELGATSINLSGAGKELPTGEESAARFYVSSAVVDGLSTPNGSAENVSVDALAGGMDGAAGTGFVEAGSISATGASSDGNSIGQTTVGGARIDMRKDADGVTHSTAAVTSASVGDVETASGDRIEQANLANLRAEHGGGALSVAASEFGVRGMSGSTTLDSASVSNLDVQAAGLGGEGWSGSLDASAATVNGLQSGNMSLRNASVEGLSASARNTADGVVGTGHVDRGQAHGLSAGSMSMGSMYVRDVDAGLTASGAVNASAERADVNRLKAGDVSVDSIGVDHFATEQRGRNDATYQAGRVRASGVDAAGTTVGNLDASGVYVDSGAGETSARIRSAEVADVAAGSTRVGGASAEGVSFDIDGNKNLDMSVNAASGRDVQTVIAGQQASIDSGSVTGAALTRRDGVANATVARTRVDGVSVGEHSMTSAEITALHGSQGAESSAIGADAVAIRGVRSGDNAVDSLDVTNAHASQTGSAGEVSVDRVSAAGLRSGDNQVATVEAKGLSAQRDGSTSSGRIDGVDVTGITAAGGTVDRASVVGIEASQDEERRRVQARAASAVGVDYGEHGVGAVWASGMTAESDAHGMRGGIDDFRAVKARTTGLTVDEVTAGGLSAAQEGDSTSVGVTRADATDIRHRSGATSASVNSARVRGGAATFGPNGVAGGASEISASGIQGRTVTSGEGGAGVDPNLIRAMGGAVQDADIRASVPMHEGRYGQGIGSLRVREGTQMDANVAIRDGHIVPGAARADFSRNLGGPAWVGVRGAYVNTDGQLRADLAGAPNINLGKSLGMGRNIDTSVAGQAERVAAGLQAGPAATPQGSTVADSFNMDAASIDAAVRLRNGQTDLGGGNSVNLNAQNSRDNVVQVQGGPQQDIVMTFTRFLTSSLRLGAGGGQVQAGSASVEQGRVSMDPGAQEGTAIEGNVGNITLRDVRGSN